LLGVRTNWSEREILAMPRARFNFYVNELLKKPDDE
jgi:hypothetical protein